MPFVTSVYIEGGQHDGETYACGPFATEAEADNAAADLQGLGRAEYFELRATADELLAQL